MILYSSGSASPDHSISLWIRSYLTLRNRCTKATVINFHRNNTCPCYSKCFSNQHPPRDANSVTAVGLWAGNTRSTFVLARGRSDRCTCWVVTATRSITVMNITLMGRHALASLKGGGPCPLGILNYGVASHLAFQLT